jgi:hypothetical protein
MMTERTGHRPPAHTADDTSLTNSSERSPADPTPPLATRPTPTGQPAHSPTHSAALLLQPFLGSHRHPTPTESLTHSLTNAVRGPSAAPTPPIPTHLTPTRQSTHPLTQLAPCDSHFCLPTLPRLIHPPTHSLAHSTAPLPLSSTTIPFVSIPIAHKVTLLDIASACLSWGVRERDLI